MLGARSAQRASAHRSGRRPRTIVEQTFERAERRFERYVSARTLCRLWRLCYSRADGVAGDS